MTTGIDRIKSNAPGPSLQACNAHQMRNYDVPENVSQQNLLNCLHVGFTGKHYSGIRQKQSGIDRIRSEKLQPFLNITVQLCFSDRSTASSKRLTKQAVLTSYVELRT